MTASLPLIINMLSEALQPGFTLKPTALLTALKEEDFLLDAIMRGNGTATIGAAIEQDFGFLHLLRVQPDTADKEIRERWAALIRWLISTLKNWKLPDNARMETLVAMLMTSRLCSYGMNLWHLLPENTPSTEFLAALGTLIAKLQIVYDFRTTASPPIWESEFIDTFQKADIAADWVNIAIMWPQLNHVTRPNTLLREIVCCLAQYDFTELVRATDVLDKCPSVMQIARALSPDQRLRLAIASNSERVRFCCAFITVIRDFEAIALSANEETALSTLLIKVASIPVEWRKWMAAFNTYPLHYPSLHRPLGYALAHASRDAAMIYIDTIKLYPLRISDADESRTLISDCLRTFSQEALPEHRQAVWTHAYQRWLDWRFGAASSENHLFDISHSQIDIAITSYACECMSTAERDSAIADLQKQLLKLELTWYSEETEHTTEWNRLLSIFQPYSHAYYMEQLGEEALSTSRVYYPFDISKSLYHRIRFRVPELKLAPETDS